MFKFVRALGSCLLLSGLASAQLPVKRVILYKNGVGYFELVGRVQGTQEVAIPFTSGQLNDVLKSLTVLDLGGGRITGVGYGSSAPLDRQLSDLRLPLSDRSSLSDLLAALRGARVEIRSGATTISGRVLSVEHKTRSGTGGWNDIEVASLITDNGEVRTAELTPGFSIKILDTGLSGRMAHYLDVVSSGRDADVRRMVVSTEGTGDRDLFVSYVSEVPVWKSTYRIVLGGKEPLLQGWAIVDNTVGQDWENVQLSLVAGAPQSFVQNLSQPYFSRRPMVPLPESMSISPQTYQAALLTGGAQLRGRVMDASGGTIVGARAQIIDGVGNIVSETVTGSDGSYEFSSAPGGQLRLKVAAPGFKTNVVEGLVAPAGIGLNQDVRLEVGSVTETITVTASAPSIQTSTASISGITNSNNSRNTGNGSALGNMGLTSRSDRFTRTDLGKSGAGIGTGSGEGRTLAVPAAATAQGLGDLFEYKLKSPVTIRKNNSALVPIVHANIAAEKISVWNDRAGLPRPARALWITNTSGLTLDGGSFSVLEEQAFAGEGIFDPIRPGEKRLVSYAIDLALNVSSKNSAQAQRVTRVRASQGVMIHENEVRERKTYTFRNEDSQPRTVIVEHPVRAGYSLRSEARPFETTADWMRFRVSVPPKESAVLAVDEARALETRYELDKIDSSQVELLVRQQSINPAVEETLRRILTQKDVVNALDKKKDAREEETKAIFDDQQRLRENMKSLKGSAEEKALLQRYTGQLNEQESRLEHLRKEIAQLEKQQDAEEEKLNTMIRGLTFDVKL